MDVKEEEKNGNETEGSALSGTLASYDCGISSVYTNNRCLEPPEDLADPTDEC